MMSARAIVEAQEEGVGQTGFSLISITKKPAVDSHIGRPN
jgi:hypothetical protein